MSLFYVKDTDDLSDRKGHPANESKKNASGLNLKRAFLARARGSCELYISTK